MYFIEKAQKCLMSYFQNRNSEERITLDGAGIVLFPWGNAVLLCTISLAAAGGLCASYVQLLPVLGPVLDCWPLCTAFP